MTKRCVKVSIIGSPNVGKSSLLNYIIKEKNSIVSPKPHTTRTSVLGVANIDNTQIIFIDTPGYIRKGVGIWADHLIQSVREAMEEVNVNLFLIDASKPNAYGSDIILNAIATNPKTIIALNKVDTRSKGKLYPIIERICKAGYKDVVYLLSARTGAGVPDLLRTITERASETEWIYEDNKEAKLSREVYAAECVREKIFYCLEKELPFQIWTTPSHWKFKSNGWQVSVDIVVTKHAHKKIVIGHHGEMIKRIGIAARTELESIWGPGQLFLNVREDSSWMGSVDYIAAICKGYALPVEL
jgi:GTP-binding protein Era